MRCKITLFFSHASCPIGTLSPPPRLSGTIPQSSSDAALPLAAHSSIVPTSSRALLFNILPLPRLLVGYISAKYSSLTPTSSRALPFNILPLSRLLVEHSRSISFHCSDFYSGTSLLYILPLSRLLVGHFCSIFFHCPDF